MFPAPPAHLAEWLQIVFYLVTIVGALSFSVVGLFSVWTSRGRYS